MLPDIAGNDRMKSIEAIPGCLEQVLSEEYAKRGKNSRALIHRAEIQNGETGLQWHRLTIDREGEQDLALSITELEVEAVEQVMGNIPIPELLIERVLKKKWEIQAAILAEKRGQKGEGKGMAITPCDGCL